MSESIESFLKTQKGCDHGHAPFVFLKRLRPRTASNGLKRPQVGVLKYEEVIILQPSVRNLHFLSKNSTLISGENCRLFWVKTRENVVVLDFLAVDSFDFTRKIVKKIWVKNS